MFLSYGSLALFCSGVAIVWFWHDSLRARDAANAAAMAACERIGLQFLDGTAAFSRLRFGRVDGRLRLHRTYVFDYTSQSIERRQGFAILVGMEVEYVGFAPEHTAQADPLARIDMTRGDSEQKSAETAQMIDLPKNVFDLNERRARRATSPDRQADATPKSDRLN
jgi:hypothetical protein